jgi:hypothetical protein
MGDVGDNSLCAAVSADLYDSNEDCATESRLSPDENSHKYRK